MVRFVFAAFLVMAALQTGIAAAQAPARVDVVALMVEFQPDTTRFTTGNGTFAGPLFEGVDAPTIDPLPHNGDYFRAHLTFLENYVGRVSDGRTQVTTHLLPEIVRVSRPMGNYSPTGLDAGSDAELAKLSALIEEAWTLADQSGMTLPAGLDPETTSFIIFHAGVGRDIELVGTTLDKTPEDLPSIFFDADALGRLGVAGVSVDGHPVTNSMVIPRTESRLGVDALTSEPFLIELSTNGLLAASFFNYLGVPDLFNTETGDSAIGPFGVMDALGIFAYSGLFPPEPSAWTKQFLGWADPVGAATDGLVRLKASGLEAANESARVPISDAEYFLVENRHRDPDGDGLRLRVWTHDGIQDVTFQNGDPEFNDQTVAGFPGGVVLEADDFDFALPGGLDENDNPLLGGILIWHVDENRLADSIESNAVNADRNARSIDLEEADGAQDIGFTSSTGLFGPRFDLGTPFDFWFEGNPVTVRTSTGRDIQLYENRFDSDTVPASLSNAGAPTGVALRDFSAQGVEMTFRIAAPSNAPVPVLGDWPQHAWGEASPEQGWLFVEDDPQGFWSWRVPPEAEDGSDNAMWFWDAANGGQLFAATGHIWPAVVDGALYDFNSHVARRTNPSQGVGSLLVRFDDPVDRFTTPTMTWTRYPEGVRLHAGVRQNGQSALLAVTVPDNGPATSTSTVVNDVILRIVAPDRDGGTLFLLTPSGVIDGNGSVVLADPLGEISSASMTGTAADWTLAWTARDHPDAVRTVNNRGEGVEFPVTSSCEPTSPVWHDLDDDGASDLLYTCGAFLYAAHRSGAVMSGFPVSLTGAALSSPVVSRATNDAVVLFVATTDGSIDGWMFASGSATRMDGFPLALGHPSATTPVLTGGALVAISGAGTIRSWAVQTNGASSAADQDVLTPPPSAGTDPVPDDLIRLEETYNWPNPVTEGQTRIRFATTEPSDIRIDIVDMNGLLIDRIETNAPGGGLPAEVIWTTEAGSGVYLARVRAASTVSGRTATHLIRIAIVR